MFILFYCFIYPFSGYLPQKKKEVSDSWVRIVTSWCFETVIEGVIENTITKENRKLKLSWENYSTSSTNKETNPSSNTTLKDIIKEDWEFPNKGKYPNGAIHETLL